MKQLMLAAVASIALSLPAMAQSNTDTMQPSSQSQNNETGTMDSRSSTDAAQSSSRPTPDQNAAGQEQQAQNTIDPSRLSTQQIRQIQRALDQKGAAIKDADGKWGPKTEAALKEFQQKQNIQGNGQLDQRTMAALGVDPNNTNERGSATTGSGSREQRMGRPTQNPGSTGAMNHGTTGQSSPSMNQRTGGNADGAYGQGSTASPGVNNGH